MVFFRILVALILGSSAGGAHSFYGVHEQGWFWYKAEKKETQNTEAGANRRSGSFSNVLTFREKIKKVQEAFDESVAEAVLVPTLANVQKVVRLQKKLEAQASKFQEMWMISALLEGARDRPEDRDAPLHRTLFKREKHMKIQQKMKRLARETGLFFVFKTGCRFCEAFAPHVRAFAQEYGFEVKAISVDGGRLPDFPEAVLDNGIAAKINPQGIYPALFLAHPASGQVVPLAWGLVTPDDLRDHLARFLAAEKEK